MQSFSIAISPAYTPLVYDAIVIRSVRLSRRAAKDLERVPFHIATKLRGWTNAIKFEGLETVRLVYVERLTKHEY